MEMVISDQKQKFGKSKKRVKHEEKKNAIEVMNYIHISHLHWIWHVSIQNSSNDNCSTVA